MGKRSASERTLIPMDHKECLKICLPPHHGPNDGKITGGDNGQHPVRLKGIFLEEIVEDWVSPRPESICVDGLAPPDPSKTGFGSAPSQSSPIVTEHNRAEVVARRCHPPSGFLGG